MKPDRAAIFAARWIVLSGTNAMEVLLQPSRRVLPADGGWTPGAAIVAEIAPLLPAVLQPLLDRGNEMSASFCLNDTLLKAQDYVVQCVGIVRGNRRLVYLNGVHRECVEGWDGWRAEPCIVFDGGCRCFGAEYDTQVGQIVHLVFNGPYKSAMSPQEGWTFSP